MQSRLCDRQISCIGACMRSIPWSGCTQRASCRRTPHPSISITVHSGSSMCGEIRSWYFRRAPSSAAESLSCSQNRAVCCYTETCVRASLQSARSAAEKQAAHLLGYHLPLPTLMSSSPTQNRRAASGASSSKRPIIRSSVSGITTFFLAATAARHMHNLSCPCEESHIRDSEDCSVEPGPPPRGPLPAAQHLG